MNYSKDYEKSGGTFTVSYTTYTDYDDARYRDYARQQAERELGCHLYEALMHTRHPAVVKIDERTVKTDYPTPQITTALTVTITPVETQHIVMPSYYELSYHYTLPSIRVAVRYWCQCAYRKLLRNWRQR